MRRWQTGQEHCWQRISSGSRLPALSDIAPRNGQPLGVTRAMTRCANARSLHPTFQAVKPCIHGRISRCATGYCPKASIVVTWPWVEHNCAPLSDSQHDRARWTPAACARLIHYRQCPHLVAMLQPKRRYENSWRFGIGRGLSMKRLQSVSVSASGQEALDRLYEQDNKFCRALRAAI